MIIIKPMVILLVHNVLQKILRLL